MELKIGWLYPNLMNTYGDRGNIITLAYRIQKRDIKVKLLKISLADNPKLILASDLLFMGGAQDKQQEIVNKDLMLNKKEYLTVKIEKGTPGLYICGAYQFLGKYYKTFAGKIIQGLSIFDLYTKSPDIKAPRLIGDLVVKSDFFGDQLLVGFENHMGRTYLGKKVKPLAWVLKGFGNNGQDKTEGVIYKNSLGSYLHGPILPKNPEVADWLIKKALEIKYKKKIVLKKLDNRIENLARSSLIQSLAINY